MPERKHLGFNIEKGGEGAVGVQVHELTVEKLEEFEEEYGFRNRSAAIRNLIWMGMRSTFLNDPRIQSENITNETGESVKLKEFVPVGPENAVDVRDELIEQIDDGLLEAVQRDPELKMDGWEVYRDEG